MSLDVRVCVRGHAGFGLLLNYRHVGVTHSIRLGVNRRRTMSVTFDWARVNEQA